MNFVYKCSSLFIVLFLTFGCSDSVNTEESKKESREVQLNSLESKVDSLEWELSRLILKIRTVNGGNLVRDKTTNLWHHDVERVPFTGKAIEYQDGRIPLAEAYFYNGQRDGTERFWFSNRKMKTEGHWYEGKRNGFFKEWNEDGTLISVEKYEENNLVESILDKN
jgi:antitoxin component YwqK of YwqJK toxin-antitoxin module